MRDDLAEFTIIMDKDEPFIGINGQDLTGLVSQLQVNVAEDTVPTVIIQFAPERSVDISGPGIVYVQTGRLGAGEFLDNVDPKILEREVLNQMQWSQGSTLLELAIDMLREAARGIESGTDPTVGGVADEGHGPDSQGQPGV